MNVRPIAAPVSGEQVVGASPPLAPTVDAGWQRRLNLYTGRSLGDAALRLEQEGRAGRLAMAGRSLSHGIVGGLEVGIERAAGIDARKRAVVRSYLHVAAGTGLTVHGEDVVLPASMRVAVEDLWVYLPAGAGGAGGEGGGSSPAVTTTPVPPLAGPFASPVRLPLSPSMRPIADKDSGDPPPAARTVRKRVQPTQPAPQPAPTPSPRTPLKLDPKLVTRAIGTAKPVVPAITTQPASPAPTQPTQPPRRKQPTKPAAEPPKREAAKPEPTKPRPVKPEAAKPDPAKPEPAKPEPAKPEPAKPEPVKPEPVKAESKPSRAETEPAPAPEVKPRKRVAGPLPEPATGILPLLPLGAPEDPTREPRSRPAARKPATLAGRLAGLREDRWSLPHAAVLVLQPVEAELVGRGNPADPCEADPQNDAYADWQRADGTRLVLYALPWEGRVSPVPAATFRNRMAYEIFAAEAALLPGEHHPWEEVGVPVALVGFDEEGGVAWVDRHAVARDGGKPRRRTPLLHGAGDPFLWQARLQQFAEQLAEVDWSRDDANDAFGAFARLPPAGILPRAAVDLEEGKVHAFPSDYLVEALPVPLEQLDAAIEASAALEPFSAATPDRVHLLVPVPQEYYERRLLHEDDPDDEFERTLAEREAERKDLIVRREDVRRKAEVIGRAIAGVAPLFDLPQNDPERVDDQEGITVAGAGLVGEYYRGRDLQGPVGLTRVEAVNFQWGTNGPADFPEKVNFSVRWTGTVVPRHSETYTFHVNAGDGVRLWVDGVQIVDDWTAHAPKESTGTVTLEAGKRYNIRLEYFQKDGSATVQLSWSSSSQPKQFIPKAVLFPPGQLASTNVALKPHEGEEDFGTEAVGSPVRRLPLLGSLRSEVAGAILPADLAVLDAEGVQAFIEHLDSKVKRADDHMDLSFLRVQTDMYRLRELMMGATAATRLATSPALAGIVKSDSALEVRGSLLKFMQGLKATRSTDGTSTPSQDAAKTPAVTGNLTVPYMLAHTQPVARVTQPMFLAMNLGVQAQPATTATRTAAAARAPAPTVASVSQPIAAQTFVASAPTLKTRTPSYSPILTAATREAVLFKPPIVGEAYDFRTVTVAERMETPAANEAKSFAVLTRHEVLEGLARLELPLDDLMIPGFWQTKTVGGKTTPVTRKVMFSGKTVELPVRHARPYAEVKGDLAALVLEENDPKDGDEAAFFSIAVELLDATVAALRNVEGRVQRVRTARDRAREVLDRIHDLAHGVDLRLKELGDRLAEARHDVIVTRTLFEDEKARVAAVNERRRTILKDHVRFYAFHRPRLAYADLDAPSRILDPAFTQSPVPECLTGSDSAPPELRAMVELLREAPLRFFRSAGELLDLLDSLPVLRGTIQAARERAGAREAPHTLDALEDRFAGRLGGSIARAVFAQQHLIAGHRHLASQLDLSALRRLSWANARQEALRFLSLGDLLDASHGRTEVDRGATRELDDILKVAACLYREMGNVRPAVRLGWAERLSQHDEAADLRNLYALPRWTEVDYLARRGMQSLVDWLFARIDMEQSGAAALVSDLVRVCILLASNAPVKQILVSTVPRQTQVRVGGSVEIAADPVQVRVGMHVLLHDTAGRPVHGVVEDIAEGQAVARVIQASAQSITIAQDSRVQLGEQARLAAHASVAARAPGTRRLFGFVATAAHR